MANFNIATLSNTFGKSLAWRSKSTWCETIYRVPCNSTAKWPNRKRDIVTFGIIFLHSPATPTQILFVCQRSCIAIFLELTSISLRFPLPNLNISRSRLHNVEIIRILAHVQPHERPRRNGFGRVPDRLADVQVAVVDERLVVLHDAPPHAVAGHQDRRAVQRAPVAVTTFVWLPSRSNAARSETPPRTMPVYWFSPFAAYVQFVPNSRDQSRLPMSS